MGTLKKCDTINERFIFNILVGTLDIEKGTTFNLYLKTPNYTYAVCKINEDDIECSIDITNFPLEYLKLELESYIDIFYLNMMDKKKYIKLY